MRRGARRCLAGVSLRLNNDMRVPGGRSCLASRCMPRTASPQSSKYRQVIWPGNDGQRLWRSTMTAAHVVVAQSTGGAIRRVLPAAGTAGSLCRSLSLASAASTQLPTGSLARTPWGNLLRKHQQRFAWFLHQPPRPSSDLGTWSLVVLSRTIIRPTEALTPIQVPPFSAARKRGSGSTEPRGAALVLCTDNLRIDDSIQYLQTLVFGRTNSGITPRVPQGLHHHPGVHTISLVSLAGVPG